MLISVKHNVVTTTLILILVTILIKLQTEFTLKLQDMYITKIVNSRCYVKQVFLVADKAMRLTCSYTD